MGRGGTQSGTISRRSDALLPATLKEYSAWLKGYIAQGGEAKTSERLFAQEDIRVVPEGSCGELPGSYGALSFGVIVMEGAEVAGNRGHGAVMTMDGFTYEGTSKPYIYADLHEEFGTKKTTLEDLDSRLGPIKSSRGEMIVGSHSSALRQATKEDYLEWISGYLKEGALPTHYYDYEFNPRDWHVAMIDFRFGSGLFGSNALSILVPSSVEFLGGTLGHSNLFFLNGFRHRGLSVPLYKDVDLHKLSLDRATIEKIESARQREAAKDREWEFKLGHPLDDDQRERDFDFDHFEDR